MEFSKALLGLIAGCLLAGCGQSVNDQKNRLLDPGTRFHDYIDEAPGPEMVVIPAGSFERGRIDKPTLKDGLSDGRPIQEVVIAEPFAMSVFQVTNAQYVEFLNEKGHRGPDFLWVADQSIGWHSKIVETRPKGIFNSKRHYSVAPGHENRAVTDVSWYGAQAYAQWLSDKTGEQYRLPTEAEWEYAVKAGTNTVYWWGNEIGENRANCSRCGSQWDETEIAPVDAFEANPFGLYNMTGNALEWTLDCWYPNYEGAPTDGSARLESEGVDCERRPIRGGGTSTPADYAASAYRASNHAMDRVGGIRLVRVLAEKGGQE